MSNFILKVNGEEYELCCIEKTRNCDGSIEIRGRIFQSELMNPKNKTDVKIEKVIFNDPATIVIWSDGSKTVIKCQPNDTYSKELGLAMCIAKKYLGNKGNYNEVFKKWIPEEISVEKMRIDLETHCVGRMCSKCALGGDDFRCGRGTYFSDRDGDNYVMTDDEIRNAYKVVFGK